MKKLSQKTKTKKEETNKTTKKKFFHATYIIITYLRTILSLLVGAYCVGAGNAIWQSMSKVKCAKRTNFYFFLHNPNN
jgi:hypothetical protein